FRIERQHVITALHFTLDQTSALENSDVLRDGIERHAEGLRNLRDPRRAARKPRQDGTARWISERSERTAQPGFRALTPPQRGHVTLHLASSSGYIIFNFTVEFWNEITYIQLIG